MLDAVVSAVIQQSGSGEFVSGVQVRHINGLQGQASVELSWPTPDHEQTAYTVAVELRAPDGTLLDTGFAEFQLGFKPSFQTPARKTIIMSCPAQKR